MKKFFFTAIAVCAFITGFAQVGIGTTTPNTSSVLDLNATNKAFLPPRMNTAQRNLISGPTAGMVIFNTTTDCIEIYRSTGWYNLCSGGGGVVDSTSNDVAASNLIAHWTFDNTTAERISGLSPTTTSGTTSFNASGRIGGAIDFSGAYLVYPPINNINKDTALAAGFTWSTWAKIPTSTLLTSLWQINSNIGDIWGTAAFTFRHAANDTLDFDGTMTHVNGTGTHSTYADAFLEGTASTFKTAPANWAFITMIYDTTGGSKKLKYYGNGVLIGTKTIAVGVIPAAEQFELITTASFGSTGRNNVTFGSFNYSPTPFAAGGGSVQSWQQPNLPAGTSIDDTRLYNRVLTQAEITTLYTRGLAGK